MEPRSKRSRSPLTNSSMTVAILIATILLPAGSAGGHQNAWIAAAVETKPTELLRVGDSPSTFLPHGICILWDMPLLLLHIVSDSIIALSYYSIPLALILIVRKRRDLAFSWMFVLFAAFIVACGTTHVMGIWTIWNPSYWLDGVIKSLTAVVSIVTAILVWPLIPKLLALPSPAQLEAANRDLQQEIAERARTEAALVERSKELMRTNVELERFNRLAVGREQRMIDLKREINDLLQQAGKPPAYDLSAMAQVGR
jgi:hypothetical protein